MQIPTSKELQIKIIPEDEEPNISLKYLLSTISVFINNKSSKIEYKELLIEEKRLLKRLLIVWVMVSTIFICSFSKITPLYFKQLKFLLQKELNLLQV